MQPVDHNERVSELAALMEEFRLSEAKLEEEGFTIAFKRRSKPKPKLVSEEGSDQVEESFAYEPPVPAVPAAPVGTPVTSPMNGIFYGSPSPSSPVFVNEGDTVTVGQIIGLIEAMKVFNEIPCTANGVVKKILVESGQIVNPGDTLILIG